MRATLRPCAACQRHVRYREARCPFCDTALPDEQPPELPDVSRLSRTARIALGAALAATALSACGGNQEMQAPPYGIPPLPPPTAESDSGASTGNDTPSDPVTPEQPPVEDPGAVKPMYGVPAPPPE
jgi:hypothetical protein